MWKEYSQHPHIAANNHLVYKLESETKGDIIISPWKTTTLSIFLRAFLIYSVNLLFNLFRFHVIFLSWSLYQQYCCICWIGASVPDWPCPVPLLSTSPTHKHPWSNSSPSPSTADHQSRALNRDMLPCWSDRQGKKNKSPTEISENRQGRLSIKTHKRHLVKITQRRNQKDIECTLPAQSRYLLVCYDEQL